MKYFCTLIVFVFALCDAFAQTEPCYRTYTTDADFDEGRLLNVNHDSPNNDQLQLTLYPENKLLPFIWVACSNRGTVVRIDVNTGAVLGEYWTSPAGMKRNPSRTTVDHQGNVWVSNRDENGLIIDTECGSVVKIGVVVGGTRVDADGTPNPNGLYLKPPFQYCTAVDRNGDGLIKTSRGLGSILSWSNNTDGVGGITGTVLDADDECILVYQRLPGTTGTRHCSVDPNNNVWVGGYVLRSFHLLQNSDGFLFERFDASVYTGGGYGGLIDQQGILWSTGSYLLRYDPILQSGFNCKVPGSYGIGLDPVTGDIWTSIFSKGELVKVHPDGGVYPGYPVPSGGASPRGVVVTSNRDIWVANSGSDCVSRLDKDGNIRKSISVGDEPTGVAVDLNGDIWVTNRFSDNVMRIDPSKGADGLGEVDMTISLGAHAEPYNYSDMTGMVGMIDTVLWNGTWTIKKQRCVQNSTWGIISWQAAIPSNTALRVYARSSNGGAWNEVTAYNGVALCNTPLEMSGEAIEVRVVLIGDREHRASPVLYDLTIAECPHPQCELAAPHELSPAETDSGFINTMFDAEFYLWNQGRTDLVYSRIELSISNDSGIAPIPGYSLSYPQGSVPPVSNRRYLFPLEFVPNKSERSVGLLVTVYDTTGAVLLTCNALVLIHKTHTISCSVIAPESIVYDVGSGLCTPDTFNIALTLLNRGDTLYRVVECFLDLSLTTHIALASPSQQLFMLSYLQPKTQRQAVWRLATVPPIEFEHTDTVSLSYRTPPDSAWYSCVCYLHYSRYIDTTVHSANCAVSGPDSLTYNPYTYTIEPFEVRYTITNTGNIVLHDCQTSIRLPANMKTTDSITKPSPPIQPGGSFTHQWSITANTSAFERAEQIAIKTMWNGDSVLASCSHNVFIPAAPDMTCSVEDTITLMYNQELQLFIPDPVQVTFAVYNKLDTIQTGIEMVLDLSQAPHIELGQGQSGTITMGSVAARGVLTESCSLRGVRFDNDTIDTVLFMWRSAQHPQWRVCPMIVRLLVMPKSYAAKCEAETVDSLWLNADGTATAPNPFQVNYALINTGNCTLHNVTATILLPSAFYLSTGETSSKTFASIAPGSYESASWMIAAHPDTQYIGMHDISFTFACDELQSVYCGHSVVYEQKQTVELGVSHTLLYFIAKQDGPPPIVQLVTVTAGSPVPFPWTAQGYPAWLEVAPSGSSATETVTVVPNTTSMPLGRYAGIIEVASSAPNSPKSIAVIYDIHNTVGVRGTTGETGFRLSQNYPNPCDGNAWIQLTVPGRCTARLDVYSILGGLAYSATRDVEPGDCTIPVMGLKQGVYLYIVRTPFGSAGRVMMVR